MADVLIGIGMVGLVACGTMMLGFGTVPALVLSCVVATVYQLVIAMQDE